MKWKYSATIGFLQESTIGGRRKSADTSLSEIGRAIVRSPVSMAYWLFFKLGRNQKHLFPATVKSISAPVFN